MDGFVYIDKPEGPTSFDLVRMARKALSTRRIGHAGTLDPMASGVLIMAVGQATRLLQYFPLEPKQYLFTVRFGCTTDTLDSEGAVTGEGLPVPDQSDILDALDAFVGDIDQVPPRYSAIHVDGSRAYELARKSQEFELQARRVRIEDLELVSVGAPAGEATLRVTCSTGTYVRSLVRDISERLGTVGMAVRIRRERVGPVRVESARTIEEFERAPEAAVVSPAAAFEALPAHRATAEEIKALGHGRDIPCSGKGTEGSLLMVYGPDENLVAVTRRTGRGMCHPERVLGQP